MRIAYVRVSTEEQNEARATRSVETIPDRKMVLREAISKRYESPAVGGNVGVCQKRRYHLYS